MTGISGSETSGAPASGNASNTRGRVLVVDDDLALAEMLGIVLRGEGFEPVFCADGSEAIHVFRESRPDIVLLDLMLPGRDGIEVCRAIRAESGTPIVMLTAKSDTIDVVVGLSRVQMTTLLNHSNLKNSLQEFVPECAATMIFRISKWPSVKS